MIETAIPTLVLIGIAAVLAPIIAEWTRKYLPVPEVVIQIILGIVIGPFVLNIARSNSIITALSDFGLTFLMFLAGTELDLAVLRQGHPGRAAGSWGVSVVVALGFGALLHGTGLVLDSVVVALCLTTTALGTLLPIVRDAGVLRTPLGPSMLSVGAIGEFGPDRGRCGVADEPRRPADLRPARPLCCRSQSWRPCWPSRSDRQASSL